MSASRLRPYAVGDRVVWWRQRRGQGGGFSERVEATVVGFGKTDSRIGIQLESGEKRWVTPSSLSRDRAESHG